MKYVTYNLKIEDSNSDIYYEKISRISTRIKELILKSGNIYLEDFIRYIRENSIEALRTKDEYAIEFIMIGVMLSEYGQYGYILTKGLSGVFNFLNKLREKPQYKESVDKIKGYLNSNILYKKRNKNLNDIKRLVYWMNETGDFKEEVYRLKVWVKFLEKNDRGYRENLIKKTLSITQSMNNICDKSLKSYLESLDEFLNCAEERYRNREDLIYCTKGKLQYYFNMVSAEIMNEVYHEKFSKCEEKKIFVPSCMRQTEKICMAASGELGYECRQCNNSCNVNCLKRLVKNKDIEIAIIPHETSINKLKIERKIGIIGIACITNLISGGWKALRLGFIPQCVILDYCGCGKHWILDGGQMTAINSVYLLKLI